MWDGFGYTTYVSVTPITVANSDLAVWEESSSRDTSGRETYGGLDVTDIYMRLALSYKEVRR